MISKTPTQVASHAQKYFIRKQLCSNSKDTRRRPSIHDITTDNLTDASLPSSENNPDCTRNNCNDSSSIKPFPELKPEPGIVSGPRLQEKDLGLAAFGEFGMKLASGPLFSVQSNRYRIYG